MEMNYWQKTLTRRRTLQVGGVGAGLVALTVIGCGGSDSGSSGKKTVESSRITSPTDTSTQAKKGGTYKVAIAADEPNVDALGAPRGAGYGGPSEPGYSRLLRLQEQVGAPSDLKIGNDIAQSYELANDGLTLTVKLRPDVKFDARAPTNGRLLDSSDVVFSLNKLFASPYASQLSNKTDPASPVTGITAIDKNTVQYKMAFPWSPLLATFASGNHLIQPKEADGGFDPRFDVRGTSLWQLIDHQTSLTFKWKKNPDWFRSKDLPYLDGYETPILTEYATRLAQFRTGALDEFQPTQADDVIALAKDFPKMGVYQGAERGDLQAIAYGSRSNSVFKDIRIRQALSMAIDRQALAIAATGQDRYQAAGIDFAFDINNHLDAAYKLGDIWIDPMGNGLGDGAKYFHHDTAAAKALVSAAGFPSGFDVLAQFPQTYVQPDIQIVAQMATEAGIRFKLEAVDSRAVWLPKLWVTGDIKGDFDGLAYGDLPMQPHVGTSAYVGWHSKGSFTAARRWDDTQDKLDDLINKANREFDAAKLRGYMQDWQKQMAVYQSGLSYQYDSQPFILTQPWVQNFRVFQDGRNATGGGSAFSQASLSPGENVMLHLWIDDTKRT